MGIERVLVLPDLHIPNHDESALRVVESFQKDFKPHKTIILGDLIDADSASCFPPGKPGLDQHREYQEARIILDRFKPNVLLEGNHEQRFRRPGAIRWELWRMLDPQVWFELKQRGITWVPYSNLKRDIYQIGKMSFIHGFSCGQYACADEARVFGCVCHGHTHRIAQFQPQHAYYSQSGFNIGCLSRLDLEYQITNRPRGWAQGFAFGYFLRSGNFSFYQVRLIGNEFVINQKTYRRCKRRRKPGGEKLREIAA